MSLQDVLEPVGECTSSFTEMLEKKRLGTNFMNEMFS